MPQGLSGPEFHLVQFDCLLLRMLQTHQRLEEAGYSLFPIPTVLHWIPGRCSFDLENDRFSLELPEQ